MINLHAPIVFALIADNMYIHQPNQTQTDRQPSANNSVSENTPENNSSATQLLLWRYSDPTATRMYEFKTLIQDKYHQQLDTYEDLRQWSITNRSSFWEQVWHFTQIRAFIPFTEVNDHAPNNEDLYRTAPVDQ